MVWLVDKSLASVLGCRPLGKFPSLSFEHFTGHWQGWQPCMYCKLTVKWTALLVYQQCCEAPWAATVRFQLLSFVSRHKIQEGCHERVGCCGGRALWLCIDWNLLGYGSLGQCVSLWVRSGCVPTDSLSAESCHELRFHWTVRK